MARDITDVCGRGEDERHRSDVSLGEGRSSARDRWVGLTLDYDEQRQGVDMAQAVRSDPVEEEAPAGARYLLLADISGYTGFMAGVEEEHGVDFSGGIPAAYSVLGDLLDAVVEGVKPDLALVKLEGDAVFAAAPAPGLDGQGDHVLETIRETYRSFVDARTRAIPANDHVCIACPAVAHLDLKVVLHRGQSVRQSVGSGSDLLGPAVTVAHRLLKNTVRDRIGARPYIFLTDAAAAGLGVPEIGIAHGEDYADAGHVPGRIVELGSAES
jgi:class 3 adenylate cyclase